MIADRVLPHNADVERAVLGACLLGDAVAIDQVRGILTPESFYHKAHRKIFAAICAVADKGKPVDQVTVVDKLTSMGVLEDVGGVPAVVSPMREMATTANAVYHAQIVQDAATRRHLIAQCGQVIERCFDATDEVDDILSQVSQIERGIVTGKQAAWVPVGEVVSRAVDRIEYARQHPGQISGITTGLADLDDMTDGLQNSDLILVAGRASMGKTALGIHLAAAAAKQVPVGVVSAEMSNNALGMRFLTVDAKINAHHARRGRIEEADWSRILSAYERMHGLPVYLSDTAKEPGEIAREVRRLKREQDIGLLVVDYLQLLDPPRGQKADTREQEVSAISKRLKGLAKELSIPVVALCQLSRAVEARKNKHPMLSDLRESGSLEQDADVVMLLYYPPYYNIFKSRDERGMEIDVSHRMEIHVAKQRNGPVGTVFAYYDITTGMFANWTEEQDS